MVWVVEKRIPGARQLHTLLLSIFIIIIFFTLRMLSWVCLMFLCEEERKCGGITSESGWVHVMGICREAPSVFGWIATR